MPDVTIFGMGYVGTVVATGLARNGKTVTAVEVSEAKRKAFSSGRLPFEEPGLSDAFQSCRRNISIGANLEEIELAPISLICVGTPRDPKTGECDARAVLACLSQLGAHLKSQPKQNHMVLIRSTLWPGAWERCRSALGNHVRLGVQPEFLREGSALDDFEHPTLHVIGADAERDREDAAQLYDFISAPLVRVTPPTAMLLKYICNSFHSMKIAFANEAGMLASSFGADPHQLMDLFCSDTRLNISSKYLRPGLPFGGSCLPKDLSQIEVWAKQSGLSLPLHTHVLEANRDHLDRYVRAMSRYKKIAIVGLTFKAGVDDLRGSPLIAMIHALGKSGTRVVGIDEAIRPDRLVDANRKLFDDLLILSSFSFQDHFDGDEEAIFVSFNAPRLDTLLSTVHAGTPIYSFFKPPTGGRMTEFRF